MDPRLKMSVLVVDSSGLHGSENQNQADADNLFLRLLTLQSHRAEGRGCFRGPCVAESSLVEGQSV